MARKTSGTRASAEPPPAEPDLDLHWLAGRLQLVSDPNRVGILMALAGHDLNVGELVLAVGADRPTILPHLLLLRGAGLIDARQAGRFNSYSLTTEGRLLVEAVRIVAEAARGR